MLASFDFQPQLPVIFATLLLYLSTSRQYFIISAQLIIHYQPLPHCLLLYEILEPCQFASVYYRNHGLASPPYSFIDDFDFFDFGFRLAILFSSITISRFASGAALTMLPL